MSENVIEPEVEAPRKPILAPMLKPEREQAVARRKLDIKADGLASLGGIAMLVLVMFLTMPITNGLIFGITRIGGPVEPYNPVGLGIGFILGLPFISIGQGLVRLAFIRQDLLEIARRNETRDDQLRYAAIKRLDAQLGILIQRLEALPDKADKGEIHAALSKLPDFTELPEIAFTDTPGLIRPLVDLEQTRHQAVHAPDSTRPDHLITLISQAKALHRSLTSLMDDVSPSQTKNS